MNLCRVSGLLVSTLLGGALLLSPNPVTSGVAWARHESKKKAGDARATDGDAAHSSTAPVAAPAATPGSDAPKAAPAKPATYQEMRDSAVEAGALANLLEPLYAECKQPSDLARRECETIREWHLERLRSTRFHTVGDASSLQSQPYDATEKSLTLVVTGCVSCVSPPAIAGAPRLVATRLPKAFDGPFPVGLDLANYEVKLENAARAALYQSRVLSRLRVDYVFTVGQPVEAAAQKGVAVTPVAYLVYNSCTGEVLGSSLPSPEKLARYPRDPSCPALGALTEDQVDEAKDQATLPNSLSRKDLELAMAPAQKRIFECGEEFDLRGNASVQIVLNPDAKNPRFTIQPPHDKGDENLCIKVALREARFPRFKNVSGQQKFNYTFVLRR